MKAIGNKNLVIATYGGTNVTDKVQIKLKQNKENLKVEAGKYVEAFTDPAPGEYKDFVMVTIDDSKTPKQFRINAFDDEDVCDVTPGPGACDTDNDAEIDAESILLANYGGKDITKEIQDLFAKQDRIEITEPHKTYTDPMEGVRKAFVVIYRYKYSDGVMYQCVNWWFDGDTIKINKVGGSGGAAAAAPAGAGYNNVLVAVYGGKDVSKEVLTWYKDEGKVDVDPSTYATHLGDHAPGEYKTFSVICVDESTTPNRFRVNHFEDEERCDVTPGASGPSSDDYGGAIECSKVLYANWGGMDITEDLLQCMYANAEFKTNAPQKIWDDPMPGVTKVFFVSYTTTWEGTPYHTANYWFDGEMIDISYKGEDSPIVEASYGGHDVTDLVCERLAATGRIVVEPGQYAPWLSDPFPNQYKAFCVVSLTDKFRVNYFDDEDRCDIVPGQTDSDEQDAHIDVKQILRATYGGMDVTECLQKILAQNGSFNEDPVDAFGDPLYGTQKAFFVVYLSEFEGLPDRDANFWMDGQRPSIKLV
jgi:hypothetical protein